MSDAVPLEHSRALRLARGASTVSESDLFTRLNSFRIVVSLEPDLSGAGLTAEVLLSTLARLPGSLALVVNGLSAGLVERLVSSVQEIDPSRRLDLVADHGHDLGLHIGLDAPTGVIRGVPEAYGVHLATDATVQIRPTRPATGLGCVLTASFLATEAFKDAAAVSESRRRHVAYVRFCPVSLTDDLLRAPDLTDGLQIDAALVGLGGIGTAQALILSHLPISGRLVLIDDQRYAPENRGTYSLGGSREVAQAIWKVDLAASHLAEFEVFRFRHPVADYMAAIDAGEAPWPAVVLAGLDSIDARHEAQRIWPDHFIDAATGDTAVGLHDASPSGPCVMCFLPKPRNSGALDDLARLTGLSARALAEGDEPLTHQDLIGLSADQAQALQPYVGELKCGLASAFGLSTVDSGGYRPSIPFVSQQAACLGVGRLLAHLLEMDTTGNFYQYDALLGPGLAQPEIRDPLYNCYCQERRDNIQRLRSSRGTVISHSVRRAADS